MIHHQELQHILEKEKALVDHLPGGVLFFRRVDSIGRKFFSKVVFEKGKFLINSCKSDEFNKYNLQESDLPNNDDFQVFYDRKQEIELKKYQLLRYYAEPLKSVSRERKMVMLEPFYRARRKAYEDYLESQEWQEKRLDCFKAHGIYCLDCKTERATSIHHLHYDSLGNECPVKDIVPLCHTCHGKRHSW